MYLLRAFIVLLLPCLLSAQSGVSPVLGFPYPGAGLALGVEYRKAGVVLQPVDFGVKAVGSVKAYEYLEAGLRLPRLAESRLFAGIVARYRNLPEEDFWGLGPNTPKDRRANFRLEDLDTSGEFGVWIFKELQAGVSVGRIYANTGPGKDGDWPSIEQVFSASQVPALDRQPDLDHWGAFLRADRRDEPDDPTRGGFYEFRWTGFHDREFHRYDFQRYEIDLRRYISVHRERDTIAMRARTVLSSTRNGQQVPFYLQPSAGGGADVRGYDQARFRDMNSLVLNLEYRWRLREMFQVVTFADAGRVFHRPSQFGLSKLHGSAGAGGRVKLGNRIFLGADLGWSPEGVHIWFRGSHPF